MDSQTELNIQRRYHPSMNRGEGYFSSCTSIILSSEAEALIIKLLDINNLIVCASVEKELWHPRMMKEIKKRKNCVTVYTWFGPSISSEIYTHQGTGTRGRMGHSALRTYNGGKEGVGVYVSFYPGECHRTRINPTCNKSVSHFHSGDQESIAGAEVIDLYGLDVDAINKEFEKLHDGNLNATIHWSPKFNCSDLVLKLLRIAKLQEKIDCSLVKYPIILGGLIGLFFPSIYSYRATKTGDLLHTRFATFILNSLVYLGYCSNRLNLNWLTIITSRNSLMTYFVYAYAVLDAIQNMFLAAPAMFLYSNYMNRFISPVLNTKHVIGDVIKGIMGAAIFPFIEKSLNLLTKIDLNSLNGVEGVQGQAIVNFERGIDAVNYFDYSYTKKILFYVRHYSFNLTGIPFLFKNIFSLKTINEQKNISIKISKNQIVINTHDNHYYPMFILSNGIILLLLFFMFHYLYNTTTTPKHVSKTITPLIERLKKIDKVNRNNLVLSSANDDYPQKNFFSKIYNNGYRLGMGALLAAGGLFAAVSIIKYKIPGVNDIEEFKRFRYK